MLRGKLKDGHVVELIKWQIFSYFIQLLVCSFKSSKVTFLKPLLICSFICLLYTQMMHSQALRTKKKFSQLIFILKISEANIVELNNQLETYIINMCSKVEFSELKGLGGLAGKRKWLRREKILYTLYFISF